MDQPGKVAYPARGQLNKENIFKPIYTPSRQSRLYRVKKLRTDGVHCRESAGTGLDILKVVPEAGAALQVTMDQLVRLSFPTPIIGMDPHTYVVSLG